MSRPCNSLLIYQYEDEGLRSLVAPAQDAEALAQVLSNPEIGGFEAKTLLNQSSSVVRREIEEFFANRKRDDLLLLYFSGHGLKDDYGRLYFATAETMRSHLRSTALSANYVNESMRDSRSRQQVLFLDCCYSGAFAKGIMVKGDKSVGTKERFEGKGRVVLTASDSLQYAFEGDNVEGEGECSIFTQALINGLVSGQADLDQDGQITIDELYDFIHDRVSEVTPKQIPGKWAFDVQGEIVIAKNPNPVIKPTLLPVELQQSIKNPLTWVREGAARELGRLLNTDDVGLQQSVYSALESMLEDDSLRVRNLVSSILAKYTGIKLNDEVEIEKTAAIPDEVGIATSKEPKDIETDLPEEAWLTHKIEKEGESHPILETKEIHPAIKDLILKVPNWAWIISVMVGVFIVFSWFLGKYGNSGLALRVSDTPTVTTALVMVPSITWTPRQTATNAQRPNPSPTPLATSSPKPSPTKTSLPPSSPTPLPSPTLGPIKDDFGVQMAPIPAGSFEMGGDVDEALAECEKLDNYCPRDWYTPEGPIHTVTLDAFSIDIYEVTNARYAECVDAEVCDTPSKTNSYSRGSYYGNPFNDDYPVIYVSWDDAKTYCEWRGARLPTEAEWEKAARGGLVGKKYPWGDTFDSNLANFCDSKCSFNFANQRFYDGYPDTAPVGTFPPNGYGLYDMAGNVWEWVADWYDPEYYANSPTSNPLGPEDGTRRVIRGGSWQNPGQLLRVSYRPYRYGGEGGDRYGIRCARSP